MKKRYPLFWKLYPSFLLMILIPLLTESGYSAYLMRLFFLEQTEIHLEISANLLKEEATYLLIAGDEASADRLCKKAGKSSDARITVILASGKVIGDSDKNPLLMDNHSNRPEVVKALSGQTGSFTRYSDTIHEPMMYLAIPLQEGGKSIGVLRISVSISAIDRQLKKIRLSISLGAILIAFLAAGVSLFISRRISDPIEKIRNGAEHFARGELNYRLAVSDSPETTLLAKTMNDMAANLEDRMQTIIRQRNELETVLASMKEGVIAINSEEKIISINQAAAKMFHLSPSASLNRSIQEIIRNPALNRFVGTAISDEISYEEDLFFYHPGEAILNTRSCPLTNAKDERIGTLIVLNDVTRLRQLENMRRDFAANVSHEIRTPLTAIKGFAETLREGALNKPEEAAQFVGIIENHANRLIAIIEDLMSLSRIEQKTSAHEIELKETAMKPLLISAIQVCQAKADEKQISIGLYCDESLSAKLNARLAEQAYVNLLDNAIKYSHAKSCVEVRAKQHDSEIIVAFQDYGIGIGREHLPRLFERFYRADKSRSRKQGGTGLGLAIVRHIVNANGGSVTVESEIGKGSVFTVHFPA
ncbi:MAG TPA: PAS domain-containing sensor histidine kinase [Desulfobacteraceae bacterium]|nr:PAS domain-containing sensor histidine kinase [Desulfobacteraceae bacterium]